ncbi:bifunctional 2-polyprenyl-6-hydroxyphenol methylase/3-demethylubiquinol 3-O-methyltransferase UbiG [Lewinella sp. 4G2]|uniref:class I SAM-dependent methyltransferase n=1 Tax=Lewinella sp. 4G2 TaxID=1803372 RepID=UPI0007B4C34B|nr:class I SAM-dependent methyltransferase [Lewinella sp. 4G2]OAV45878.1 methyltransferase type 12 [Lewinella sp. 4G2]
MINHPDYLALNKDQWNQRTAIHLKSDFYDVPGWLNGAQSLMPPELDLLPKDLTGLKVLHLQCHFGQDTLSLARMGAEVTGVDLSDAAIAAAKDLARQSGLAARFINCDLYSLPDHLDEAASFDIVFTSYGTITWLPDLDRWATIIRQYLKPGGQFVFAEFHNFAYLWNEDRTAIKYPYFNEQPIVEEIKSTYTDGDQTVTGTEVNWDHPVSSVITTLIRAGLTLNEFHEFEYSPYACFDDMVPGKEEGQWWLKQLPGLIPLVYSLRATAH